MNPFLRLIGSDLSAVVFVRDYVQLQFGEHIVNATIYPIVNNADGEFKWGAPCYRDALCELIDGIVARAFLEEGESCSLEFEDGKRLVLLFEAEECHEPDTVIFMSGGQTWVYPG